ncbi:hypothetical protein [Piscinibacter koreensis]|uniref:Uncharacterized protein n=1 Tax=Piscinibacter koreensis TaxID=2742824 RepID=A0A7Y6NNS4_9BURK|nr:hypothetical protein [Schlegelella koreensis]NUZ06586.1 hypothetical protein [Schlegelella koreensis]
MDAQQPDARAELARLGIAVPEEDLAFLQRALQRQRELLCTWREQLPRDAEPATVFRPLG